MGLFDRLIGGNAENYSKLNWIALTENSQLYDIIEESKTQTVVIFKHSTRCGISKMVLRGFEDEFDLENDKIKLYFLDLLNYREISGEISSRFNVRHESPQLLVFRDGEVVYHTSHGDIKASKLNELVF